MLHKHAMKPAKSVNFLKPPCVDKRRSSIGSVHESGLEDARRRSSTSFSGLTPTTTVTTTSSPIYQKQLSADGSQVPLDVRQLYRLRASWKVVQRNMENVGMDVMMTFFRLCPETFEHYKLWNVVCCEASSSLNLASDKKFDVLKFDEDFKMHSRKFLQYFDDIIQRFDDYEARNNAIRSLTCYQRRLCQGPPETILKLQAPFLDSMRRTLEDRFNKEVEAIYSEFLEFVLNETLQKLRTSSSRTSSIDTSRLLDSPVQPNHLRRRRSGTPGLSLPRIDD